MRKNSISTPKTPKWFAIGDTMIGASHVRSGKPNQDAIKWWPHKDTTGPPIAVAVSDGHGSNKCFRSDIGSQLAVEIATEMLSKHFSSKRSKTEDKLPAVESWLVRKIVQEWINKVTKHLTNHPFTEDELQRLRDKDGEKAVTSIIDNPLKAYGATLLAAIVISDAIVLLQLGDGDILCVADDGTVWHPFTSDDRLIANATTSLCLKEAWNETRVSVQRLAGNPPAIIMLSTDGYSNCFSNDNDFDKVGYDFLQLLRQYDSKTIVNQLPVWLSEATSKGSGDDITVGMIVRLDTVKLPVLKPHSVNDKQVSDESESEIIPSGKNA